MAKKMFGKRVLSTILALVLVCNLMPLMGAMATENEVPATVQNFPDTYYKQNGSAGSVSDWEIHLSKIAAPTDQDNIFDITLKVETKDTSIQTVGSTNGAAVLVLDVSSSMVHTTGSCGNCGKAQSHSDHKGNRRVCNYKEVTHLELLKKAVKSFLDSYVADAAEGDKRMVAIVKFATDADTVLNWIDVNNEANMNSVKSAVDAMRSTSGTNIEAGMVLGRNLLKSSALSGIPLANQSLILFSDGEPTVAVGNVNNDSVTHVASDNRGIIGGGNRASDDLTAILAAVSAKKKAVAYNTDADLLKNVFGAENVITSSADSLALDLAAEAGEIVTSKTNASTVTDPMGTGVSMISVTTNYNAATKNWDLSKVTPVVENGITTYTITYRVELDPMAIQLDPAHPGFTVLTSANGATTLNYTYGENDAQIRADFNEPNIRGVRNFTVSYAYAGDVPAGAPEVPADAAYKAGASVTVAAEPTLENYTFSGWSKSDFVMPAADVTIVGTWSENAKYSYALIYNANFGTDPATENDEQNIADIYDAAYTIEVNENMFSRENYTFIGWNTQADGKGIAYSAEDLVALTAANNSEVLYAQWQENTKYDYSLIYNANFGTDPAIENDEQNIAGTYADTYTMDVNDNMFDRDHYDFIGWALSADGEVVYQSGDKVIFTESGSIKLYAQWVEHGKYSYSVLYNGNGGILADGNAAYGDAENIVGIYDTEYNISVDSNSFLREHYNFVGWNTEADGTGTAYTAEDVIALTAKENIKTLFAQWEVNSYNYTVVYMVRVGDGEYVNFTGVLPENAPLGAQAVYGTVIDKTVLQLPEELADDTNIYSYTTATGIIVGDGDNVVYVYYSAPEIVEIPEEDVPLVDVPLVDVPLVDVPLVDIPDENIPTGDNPHTGDPIFVYVGLSVMSGFGILALNLKKKEEDTDE